MIGLMPPVPSRIADLGCGTGTLSLLLAEEGHAVDGVDLSPEMVRRASAKAGTFPGAGFVVGDAADAAVRGRRRTTWRCAGTCSGRSPTRPPRWPGGSTC